MICSAKGWRTLKARFGIAVFNLADIFLIAFNKNHSKNIFWLQRRHSDKIIDFSFLPSLTAQAPVRRSLALPITTLDCLLSWAEPSKLTLSRPANPSLMHSRRVTPVCRTAILYHQPHHNPSKSQDLLPLIHSNKTRNVFPTFDVDFPSSVFRSFEMRIYTLQLKEHI